jgi:hypothetical protein
MSKFSGYFWTLPARGEDCRGKTDKKVDAARHDGKFASFLRGLVKDQHPPRQRETASVHPDHHFAAGPFFGKIQFKR